MNPLPARAQAVLDFWFGAPGSAGFGEPRAEWFRKDEVFDARIRQHFGDDTANALAGGLAEWTTEPEGALALILLLDQFPRNLFRGHARAFAGDDRARQVARRLTDRAQHQTLQPVQRVFVYLPFEHAESMEDQDRAVDLFRELHGERPDFAGFLDYAQKHREVIQRFGRFPHRNAALGRESTVEEKVYLAQPGSGF